ncbi:MAG: acyl carrier protein [Rhodospirillales bacterium]|nr:acyl carrier protein [Rhodospirillales bacterium]
MTRDDLNLKLREIFSMLLDSPMSSIAPDTSPDTNEKWDSLMHIKLVCAIEEEFGVLISPEEQFEMMSVELVEDIVVEKL